MSLDVLFTEAAEAGGPPRFTEDDIAHRVDHRRQRRRQMASVAAALIVLGGIGLGVYLAGEGDEPSPVVEPAEIPAVPVTEEALAGLWIAVGREDVEIVFADDLLTFSGCPYTTATGSTTRTTTAGAWNVVEGRLGTARIRHHEVVDECSLAELAFFYGVPTLYKDGLLRFATADAIIDFARDGTSPDPAAARAERRPLAISPRDVAGRWTPVGADASAPGAAFVGFSIVGRYSFSGCNEGGGTWSVFDGRLQLTRPIETTLRTCRALPGQPLLDSVLSSGEPLLTTDGDLVLRGPEGAVFLRRVSGEPDETVPPEVELTDRRWIMDVGPDPASSLAPWIEFADDGTFTMTVSCGLGHGTWTRTGDEIAVTVTDSGDGNVTNCAEPEAGVDALGPITSIRVGDELVVEHESVADVGGGPDTSPDQVFRPLDSLRVPTDEDLLGEWSAGLTGSSGSTRTLVTFHDDGTLTPGDCPPSPWHMTDGVIGFDGTDDPCLIGFGFESPLAPIDVRLDGDVLYLSGPDSVTLLVRGDQHMNDTSISVNGPGPSLRDAFADMGVEACCQVNGDGLTRRGFVWEGHEVGVEARMLADSLGDLGLDGTTVELDGQVVRGQGYRGTELAFDCGGYRFGMYTEADPIPAEVLLDAATSLLAVLPCRAAAPT